jgi:Zn-finger nucleic acid-binding protein
MICPECGGKKDLQVPSVTGYPIEYGKCPKCEGKGEIPDPPQATTQGATTHTGEGTQKESHDTSAHAASEKASSSKK